jgi:hypothetical protein
MDTGNENTSHNDVEFNIKGRNSSKVGRTSDDNIIKTSTYCDWITSAIIIMFILGIIASVITYVVYVIKSLCQTSYYEQKNLCSESNAWIYLLLSMVINAFVGLCSEKSKNESEKSNSYCTLTISGLAFMIWGCVELYGVKCVNKLDHTLLYTTLKITVLSNIVITCLLMLFGVFICSAICNGNHVVHNSI